MVDSRADELVFSVGRRDFTIKQSPGLLNSSRAAGTTGAVMWRTTRLLASWFGSNESPLFHHGLLDAASVILELGSGTAGLLPLILAPKVSIYCATDQDYTIRLLRENIEANRAASRKLSKKPANPDPRIFALDWENDDLKSFLTSQHLDHGVDLVLASDCVYNYHLIKPFVQACVDTCRVRSQDERPSLCMVAQQLRQPDVFEEWLSAFAEHFSVWRLNDEVTGSELSPSSGYVIHVGILKSAVGS